MIKRIVKMEFESDNVETFKSIFKKNHPKIASQEGCHGVQLLQDINESNIFFTFSEWETQEHLDLYRENELFKEIWGKIKVLFSNKPIAWSVQEIL